MITNIPVRLFQTQLNLAGLPLFIGGLILLFVLYEPLPEKLIASSALRNALGVLIGVVLFPFALALMSVVVSSISIQLNRWLPD